MLLSGKKHIIILGSIFIAFLAVLLWWFLNDQPLNLITRVPGMDNRPKMAARSDSVIIGEHFDTLAIMDEIIAGDWPGSGELILIILVKTKLLLPRVGIVRVQQ